jgi:hypothetical protein
MKTLLPQFMALKLKDTRTYANNQVSAALNTGYRSLFNDDKFSMSPSGRYYAVAKVSYGRLNDGFCGERRNKKGERVRE